MVTFSITIESTQARFEMLSDVVERARESEAVDRALCLASYSTGISIMFQGSLNVTG